MTIVFIPARERHLCRGRRPARATRRFVADDRAVERQLETRRAGPGLRDDRRASSRQYPPERADAARAARACATTRCPRRAESASPLAVAQRRPAADGRRPRAARPRTSSTADPRSAAARPRPAARRRTARRGPHGRSPVSDAVTSDALEHVGGRADRQRERGADEDTTHEERGQRRARRCASRGSSTAGRDATSRPPRVRLRPATCRALATPACPST